MSRRRAWEKRGWERDGELTETGERRAEYEAEARAGFWDPPAEFDDPSPTRHGWAPNPYPSGGLV